MKPEKAKALRCAIYTRVSTEHGLEQEFNSLQNQREAAEAYVKSQAHEGWRLLPPRYDDGVTRARRWSDLPSSSSCPTSVQGRSMWLWWSTRWTASRVRWPTSPSWSCSMRMACRSCR